ncbi:MAG: cell division protein FtsZ [Treponema sp.]|nr:cell division protein FtsZ [Treponema sp.]
MNVSSVRELKSGLEEALRVKQQLHAACGLEGVEVSRVLQFKPQEFANVTNSVRRESHVKKDVPAIIKVISAGGGGGNALNRMIEANLSGVEFIALNTDIQDLNKKSMAEVKVQIGTEVTGGRGAGGIPEKGERAALEDQVAIAEALKGADMVFITAGMGGGTGTGSAPVIAKIAKQLGALTVAVVTTPFDFEGRYKMRLAEEGIAKLRKEVDTLIVIPNQHLFKIVDNTTTWNKAFLMADEVLCRGVQGISELITETGFQNTDFADIETIMKGKGDALMGIGFGTGDNRAMAAVTNAIDNPLLEDTCIEGATGILINIAGPEDITMVEIQSIVKSIKEKCDSEAHIIQGLRIDPELENSIRITVIATGFKEGRYTDTPKAAPVKIADSDFIDYNEYVRMVEKTKRPEYLSYLPQREYQDDLDVPSVIRKHNFHTEEKQAVEAVQGC